ncbi:MAG: hypothetical protein MNPFHGCM_02000 [Gemmatimonadaceae bacterium]|nr:hypothetical protein [Gemmatimonadaceae bacterium]
MTRSKQQALMFLLGALLVGGALGFTADRMMIQDRICSTAAGKTDARKRFAERLSLTADQERKVDALLDERNRQYDSVMATIQGRVDSIKMHSRAQIRLLLNSDQSRAFDEFIAEMSDSTKNRDED